MSMLTNAMSGLMTSQIALNIVGNNVANVNVEGYSRQQAEFSANVGQNIGRLSAGMGAQVDSILRLTDDYLNNSVWRSSSTLGYNQVYSQYFGGTEQVLANENLSVANGINILFTAFSSASADPSAIATRQLVISSAAALGARFNTLASNLDISRTQSNQQADAILENSNSLFIELATLNKQVVEGLANGANVSALQDHRDQSVKQLASLMDLEVTRLANGSMTISMSGGQPLVLGGTASSLSRSATGYQVNLAGQAFGFNGDIGGKLGGILSYQTQVLDPTQTSLDMMAKSFADEINTQLAAGQDINTPATPGKPLFTYNPGDPAGSLAVIGGYKPEDLAFAGKGAGPGDNTNLNAIHQLKDNHYDSYNALIGKLAIQGRLAKAQTDASTKIADAALAKRDSVSGVNLDEEAMSLKQYHMAYQANAKVLVAADQMFKTLLNIF